MKIAAVCCTYHRPTELAYMVRCFERQTYPDRELVILDDANQYVPREGPNWRLVSIGKRFASLGAKRNAAARLVSQDVEAICPWDDDDLYMPWHLEATAWALEQAEWSRPSQVLHRFNGWYQRHATYGREDQRDKAFQGGWGILLSAFWAAGGYPEDTSNGEDKLLARRLVRCVGSEADYCDRWPPGYVWGPWPATHLSCLGPANDGYVRLGDSKPQPHKQHFSPKDPPAPLLIEANVGGDLHRRIFDGDWS